MRGQRFGARKSFVQIKIDCSLGPSAMKCRPTLALDGHGEDASNLEVITTKVVY